VGGQRDAFGKLGRHGGAMGGDDADVAQRQPQAYAQGQAKARRKSSK
jgi:hypothetical protein